MKFPPLFSIHGWDVINLWRFALSREKNSAKAKRKFHCSTTKVKLNDTWTNVTLHEQLFFFVLSINSSLNEIKIIFQRRHSSRRRFKIAFILCLCRQEFLNALLYAECNSCMPFHWPKNYEFYYALLLHWKQFIWLNQFIWSN